MIKKGLFIFTLLISVVTLAACGDGGSETIQIGEGDWESNEFHDAVAVTIIEEGYGFETEVSQVDTPVLMQSLTNGDIHFSMEIWTDNTPAYADGIEDGTLEDLSVNFDDNYQGIYIPKYLQEEHPDLTSIEDLPDYKDIFDEYEEDSSKAVVYGGPSGWEVTSFLEEKFENDEDYSYLVDDFHFYPLESTSTLNTTLVDAYDAEEPWVGYNWEPTWILGEYDMVLLDDPHEYDAESGRGNPPAQDVKIVSNIDFSDEFPDVADFLSNYETSSDITSEALAYMREEEASPEDTAHWWLLENQDLWTEWVPDDVADDVLSAIE
ncbi:MAG: glycine betaine ABC transporter substrate-binding protein [Candidatus Izemoplasmataceae bacterium]